MRPDPNQGSPPCSTKEKTKPWDTKATLLFDTPVYFFFLTLVVLIYWRLAWRQQNLFLVAVSYLFYGWWDWRFLGLIWISTIVDYYCALWVARSTDPRLRKTWLAVSVVLNLAFLGTFKYFNFFSTSLSALLNSLGLPVSTATLDILLPPGISFYTFQALAYITDVYFRKLEPSKNLVDYALFISFFPHLIAGPVLHHAEMMPQFLDERRGVSLAIALEGLVLFVCGLAKKVLIADSAAVAANRAFLLAESGPLGWLDS